MAQAVFTRKRIKSFLIMLNIRNLDFMFARFCNSLSCEKIVTAFPLYICIKFLQFHNMGSSIRKF
jgi:hypothetical protein